MRMGLSTIYDRQRRIANRAANEIEEAWFNGGKTVQIKSMGGEVRYVINRYDDEVVIGKPGCFQRQTIFTGSKADAETKLHSLLEGIM